MYDFPIEPSSYSTDVSVITAQNTSRHANITSNNLVHNIPSTSNNVQYPGHDSSLINTMLTLSVPTEILSSTMDNTNVCILLFCHMKILNFNIHILFLIRQLKQKT